MARKHLTDTLIRDALSKMPPGTPRVEWVDDVPPFVRVRLSPGLAVFSWLGRNPTTRKPERHKLGILGPTMGIKLAREAAAKLKGAAHEGKDLTKAKRTAKRAADAGRMTIADMRDAYLARCEADGKPLAPATQRTYLQVLPWLLGDYMERPVDALDSDTLMQLVTEMGKRRTVLSPHGLKLKRGNKGGATIAVKALARLCKVHKINDDPTRDLRADKRLPVIGARPGRLGMEESQQLFTWLHWFASQPDVTPYKLRGARMLMVAIVTGWRISTVAAWQWEEIDFTAMTTRLPKNKSGHKQTVPLWPVLAEIFKPLRQKSGPVFAEKWPQEFKRTLPLQVSPHDARKAFAAVMLDMSSQAGVHPMAVELLMQHFNSVTVKNYLMTVPLPDQLRILRPTVAKVSEYYAAKLGDKATLKAMEKLAAVRRVEASEYERDRWAATAARKRAKAA